jgi:SAM-dependent methyltransferase
VFKGGNKLKCGICGGSASYKVRSIEGYKRGQKFDVLACDNCQVSYVNPLVPDQRLYEAIYSNVQNVPGYSGYFELANAVSKASDPLAYIASTDGCYFGVAKHIRDTVVAPNTYPIVEIGCGQGYLTYALNKAGYRTIGVDISEAGICLAKERFGDNYFCGQIADWVNASNQRPALIVCTELIEHLSDPFEFMQVALENLDSGGQLLFTTPHKVEGEVGVWDTELPPVHLWWFSKKSLVEMSSRLNAGIQFVDLSKYYFDNPGHRPGPEREKPLHSSLFDESYNLIAPVKYKSAFRKKLRNFEKQLKSLIYKLIGRNMLDGQVPFTDANSISICAVLTKR